MFTAVDPVPKTVSVSVKTSLDRTFSLPEPAVKKLDALRLARNDARALFDAAHAKVLELREPDSELVVSQRAVAEYEKMNRNRVRLPHLVTDEQGTPTEASKRKFDDALAKLGASEAAAYERLRRAEAELAAARDLERQRGDQWKALNSLVGNIERWLAETPRRLTPVPFEAPTAFAGKQHAESLAELRDLIAALTGERRRVERASLPPAEAKRRIRPWVERQAARVRVLDALNHDSGLAVSEPDNNPAIAYACWINPDAVVRRLEQEVEQQAAGRFALTELEKAKKLAELDAQLLGAERREEALISIMAEAGTVVPRRPGADPRAVLGLS